MSFCSASFSAVPDIWQTYTQKKYSEGFCMSIWYAFPTFCRQISLTQLILGKLAPNAGRMITYFWGTNIWLKHVETHLFVKPRVFNHNFHNKNSTSPPVSRDRSRSWDAAESRWLHWKVEVIPCQHNSQGMEVFCPFFLSALRWLFCCKTRFAMVG